jgi:AcrR family transcriptional regulator
MVPQASTPEPDHRARLLEAMAVAVTEKGYAQTTIADVARCARVSKRTFYEHFADKEECFLAAYATLSDLAFDRIAKAAEQESDPEARLEAALRAYIAVLEEQPAMTRSFLMEIQAAGAKALLLRRAILGRYSDLLRLLVDAARAREPDVSPLSPAMATAVVGGINELLLLTIEQGSTRFGEVGTIAKQLIRAVVLPPASARRPA